MQTTNPFPGMNPLLEHSWPDVHTRLINYISDTLADELPLDLAARMERGTDFAIQRPTHRWIEIRETSGRLITAIEVLSPANKIGQGRAVFLEKQQHFRTAGVNFVQIDLLRVGQPVFSDEVLRELRRPPGTNYLIAAIRAQPRMRWELYHCPLRQRLPAVRIPLRPTDLDVPLDLQPLIDRVYRTGRYWQLRDRSVPEPALQPDDALWVEEQMATGH